MFLNCRGGFIDRGRLKCEKMAANINRQDAAAILEYLIDKRIKDDGRSFLRFINWDRSL
jgi:hypothetical protein